MNVLIWSPGGLGEHYYGPGTNAYRLYQNIEDTDNVSLYLAHGFKDQEDCGGMLRQHFLIHDLSNNSRFSHIIFLIKSFFWIKKNYKRFDVVHCLSTYLISFLPALWLEKRSVKVVCKVTGSISPFRNNNKISKILNLAYFKKKKSKLISYYIAISADIEKMLLEGNVKKDRILRIPNGVNINRFKPIEESEKTKIRKLLLMKDIFTLVFIGQVCNRKQPFLIVQALRELIYKYNIELQALIIGPELRGDNELQMISEYVVKNELQNYYTYIKQVNNPELYLKSADIFILPSKSEGMANALLEAMACGLPSLVTQISGSKDLIHDGENGFFVKNSDDIVQKVIYYLSNKEALYEHGLNSRKIIINDYSDKQIYLRHLNVYKALCNKTNVSY